MKRICDKLWNVIYKIKTAHENSNTVPLPFLYTDTPEGWRQLSEDVNLSEDFIRKFADKVDWTRISYSQNLSEEFIREFADKVDWRYISMFQNLSEDFIEEFYDKIDWEYMNLNRYFWYEKRIRRFIDKVDWSKISYYSVSLKFIEEYAYNVDLNRVCETAYLPDSSLMSFLIKSTLYLSQYAVMDIKKHFLDFF